MTICVLGNLNPEGLKNFLYKDQTVPTINITATAVTTYVKELLLQGYDVIVITSSIPGNSFDTILKGNNILIHIVHSNPGFYLTHALSRIYMIRRLNKVIGEYIDKIDIIHAQWTYEYAFAAKSYSEILPVFCTVRDWCPYILSLQKGFKKIQWYLYYFIFKSVMDCDKIHFIANSEYTYKCIVDKYPQKSVSIIYNPIDKDFIMMSKNNIISSSPVFIFISGYIFERRKNVYTLIEAFSVFHNENPNSELKIVGKGNIEGNPRIVEYKSRGMLEGVSFLGAMDHDSLMNEIDKCSCLVHPSLEETFGNILVEGMARRVIVIGGSKSGAVPSVLGYGKCGILCDITDPISIKNAMDMSTNADFSSSIINNATKFLIDNYSSDTIVRKHIDTYLKYSGRQN